MVNSEIIYEFFSADQNGRSPRNIKFFDFLGTKGAIAELADCQRPVNNHSPTAIAGDQFSLAFRFDRRHCERGLTPWPLSHLKLSCENVFLYLLVVKMLNSCLHILVLSYELTDKWF